MSLLSYVPHPLGSVTWFCGSWPRCAYYVLWGSLWGRPQWCCNASPPLGWSNHSVTIFRSTAHWMIILFHWDPCSTWHTGIHEHSTATVWISDLILAFHRRKNSQESEKLRNLFQVDSWEIFGHEAQFLSITLQQLSDSTGYLGTNS